MSWKTLCEARVSDYVCLRFWPAFNLADLALAAGAIGTLILLLFAVRNGIVTWAQSPIPAASKGFPRFFRIVGYSINSYKLFLCVGIYVGTLATAALASLSGLSPLRVGIAAMSCALAGLIGARLYYLLVNAPFYLRQRSLAALWESSAGGWSLFGSLLTLVPVSFAAAAWLHIPRLSCGITWRSVCSLAALG